MGRADYYSPGDWNVQCWQCGFKRKASMMEKNWQGFYVCPEHNEPRQTQDFVRGVPDMQAPPWTQPIPKVVYTYTNAVIGYGNGSVQSLQFGSGLVPPAVTYNVTNVLVDGAPPMVKTISPTGVIVILSPIPSLGQVITASGTETLA